MYQGTEVYNLCKETLGVAYFAKDYLWTVFFPGVLSRNP